jgi:hypothetical protein
MRARQSVHNRLKQTQTQSRVQCAAAQLTRRRRTGRRIDNRSSNIGRRPCNRSSALHRRSYTWTRNSSSSGGRTSDKIPGP